MLGQQFLKGNSHVVQVQGFELTSKQDGQNSLGNSE